MEDNPKTKNAKPFELKGKYVVLLILLLTGVVGALFIYLGPRAIEKRPGVLHVGLRFTNEGSIDFLRYGKRGPEARFELINPDGETAFSFDGLGLGRNLIPLENLPSGAYTARITTDDFQAAEVPVLVEGRMLNPQKDFQSTPYAHVDYNMVGVRLLPRPPHP